MKKKEKDKEEEKMAKKKKKKRVKRKGKVGDGYEKVGGKQFKKEKEGNQ